MHCYLDNNILGSLLVAHINCLYSFFSPVNKCLNHFSASLKPPNLSRNLTSLFYLLYIAIPLSIVCSTVPLGQWVGKGRNLTNQKFKCLPFKMVKQSKPLLTLVSGKQLDRNHTAHNLFKINSNPHSFPPTAPGGGGELGIKLISASIYPGTRAIS